MKNSRFSDSQIIAILKQAEGGSPVPELCREHGIIPAYTTCEFLRVIACGDIPANLNCPPGIIPARNILRASTGLPAYIVSCVCELLPTGQYP